MTKKKKTAARKTQKKTDIPDIREEEARLIQDLHDLNGKSGIARATLKTDDRVLARITDGIYRQPSSALRELISNAYDADARKVIIETDYPRFSKIRISDNGIGMNEEVLARLIHHIGGSSKRTSRGRQLGTTSQESATHSPSGRRLIGKIGIGLFSVSQLTSHFQIITKIKGSSYRLFADVILYTYSEGDEDELSDGKFKTGTVEITKVPAKDQNAHGTEIILMDIKPRARDILRSKERWQQIFEQDNNPDLASDRNITKPAFHTGYLDAALSADTSNLIYHVKPALPWKKGDAPASRFRKLYDKVKSQAYEATERPDLAKTLDGYLNTIWTLGLSAPVSYMEKHPFDITGKDDVAVFKLSNEPGRALPVHLNANQTIRQVLNLKSGSSDPAGSFQVFVDEIELLRPISFKPIGDFGGKAARKSRISQPMIFVGALNPNLDSVPPELRGGDLQLEGYLFWNHRIIPKENNGVLIRINNSSGAPFDETFMKYQVSEQTRLRQTTSEIFVSHGLDAALNIDRESFNFAHPHYQILSQWLHRSLRQLANTHKGLSAESKSTDDAKTFRKLKNKLEKFAESEWRAERKEQDEDAPDIEIASTKEEAVKLRKQGAIVLHSNLFSLATAKSAKASKKGDLREQKAKALATILHGFGVLDAMDFETQNRLITAIMKIFLDSGEK